MIILVGKTCSGKSTVANIIEAMYNIPRVRTYTTRPRREGEGDEYNFVSKEEFFSLKEEDFFFETTSYDVATGETWYYGTPKKGLIDNCCIVMNPEGMKKVRHFLDLTDFSVLIVFLNVTEGMQYARLRKRGDLSDEATRRVAQDSIDFEDVGEYYDIAINTDHFEPKEIADFVMHLIKEQRYEKDSIHLSG